MVKVPIRGCKGWLWQWPLEVGAGVRGKDRTAADMLQDGALPDSGTLLGFTRDLDRVGGTNSSQGSVFCARDAAVANTRHGRAGVGQRRDFSRLRASRSFTS